MPSWHLPLPATATTARMLRSVLSALEANILEATWASPGHAQPWRFRHHRGPGFWLEPEPPDLFQGSACARSQGLDEDGRQSF